MEMRKRLISLALGVTLLTGTAGAVSWPQWAEQAEQWAEQKGLSETFTAQPFLNVTRGSAAQMIYEAAGRPYVSGEIPFVDIPEEYADAVTWAAENGYVKGIGDEKYAPWALVTRQEFAVILYRGAGSPDPYAYTLEDFADVGSVSGWARDAMRWCVGTGLMNGKADNMLAPRDTIIVAEAALMLQRADTGAAEEGTASVSSLEEIKTQLRQAMQAAEQPPVFDVGALTGSTDLKIDIQNLYNALLSEQPALKYAYDLEVSDAGNGLVTCTFSYMPYRTGNYPAGFDGETVSGIRDLLEVTRKNIRTQEDTPIYITDRELTVDNMNKALQQVGGSYILCQLNQDGTAITYTPANNASYTDCVARLDEIDRLADAIIADCTDSSMSDYEKAEALYTYLTENVLYDHRYYSDPNHMPYDSRTAYGAFHDQLAICGGYAQALQTLFDKAGIPCYTVSGSMGGEYHMWDIAYLDGQWRYFDATSDRGRADYWFNYFNVSAEQLTRYEWDKDFTAYLTGATA